MNKRVFYCWLVILPPLFLLAYLLIQNHLKSILLKDVFFYIMLVLFFLWPYYAIGITPFVCSPKKRLPRNVNLINLKGDIECYQKSRTIYEVSIGNKKTQIDMTSWIFKKTYIRDIILMYYHLSYYNENKLRSFKCNSKRYFKDKDVNVIFNMLNGKAVKMPVVKNGVEKRSILCDLKIFLLAGSLDRRSAYKKDKHYRNEVANFYI